MSHAFLKKGEGYGRCRIAPCLLAGIFLAWPFLPGKGLAEDGGAAGGEDHQIAAFFQSVEQSFKSKSTPAVMAKLHRKFSYIMTYCTDEAFTVVENNIESYRTSVGTFFMNDPAVLEFAITVEQIERLNDSIGVLARIKSVVELNGIRNACYTSSNYRLLVDQDRFLIKDIRGDATCTNTKLDAEAAE